ncbi:MAG TPA: DUF6002 family protein [Streptosporangiaceae bacterium]|nr:DUF6002 family protein [Streptosporangiaceae bacterium]
MTGSPAPTAASGNLLADYYEMLPRAIAHCVPDPAPVTEPASFSPGFSLPELTGEVREFLAAATVAWQPLGEYAGHPVTLLDLSGNPGTNTTKTFASLLIVARAVEFINRTGEPIMIFSPTSANKGVALRDAVLRAIQAGLARPDQLRVAILVPEGSWPKLRSSPLATDRRLRALNPVFRYAGPGPEHVKQLGKDFVRSHAEELWRTLGLHVWYTLELPNYLVADTARAFFEHAIAPAGLAGRPRTHAHAVSSAFGLLGYHTGREVLEQAGLASATTRPGSLLVQHLATPDMVLHLLHGSFDRDNMPAFELDRSSGTYRQSADPHFPQVASDPGEVLDATFYSHCPATSPAMDEIIGRYGGDGVVVSRHECLERYPLLRDWFGHTQRPLPAAPGEVREWSAMMAVTGALAAIDRDLIKPDHDIVVHGSGWYTAADFTELDPAVAVTVAAPGDIMATVTA